jgi:hypothetical protein
VPRPVLKEWFFKTSESLGFKRWLRWGSAGRRENRQRHPSYLAKLLYVTDHVGANICNVLFQFILYLKLELHLFPLLTEDSVFPHPGSKSADVETKEYRCPVFSLDSPTGFLEHLQDVVAFQHGEGWNYRVLMYNSLELRD